MKFRHKDTKEVATAVAVRLYASVFTKGGVLIGIGLSNGQWVSRTTLKNQWEPIINK